MLCISQHHVVFYVYKYDSNNVYTTAGLSALLKADKVLIAEATDYNDTADGNPNAHLNYDHSQIPSLKNYNPIHEDLDLNFIVVASCIQEPELEIPIDTQVGFYHTFW